MEETLIEKEKPGKIFIKSLKNDYGYEPESILIKTIFREQTGSIALFILDKEQGLIEHAASSDALVYVLEGDIEFTIAKQNYMLKEGEFLKLPAGIPHSLSAIVKAKMLLIIFS